MPQEELITQHGGYRNLKTFILARLIFDITIRFCDRFISRGSRTHDQMVQAARSGVQNIAEGSQASGTSKKTEIKLTSVARASLEELKLDFEDFLRQKGYLQSKTGILKHDLIQKRPGTADEFALWVKQKSQETKYSVAEIAANGALILLNITCSLLDRQLKSQAEKFQREGGFTERMYKIRSEQSRKSNYRQ